MKYFIEKRSLANPNWDPVRFYFNIRDNAIGKQWLNAQINLLYKNNPIVPKTHPLDKVNSNVSDIEFLCERFNHGVNQTNKHIDGYEHIDVQLDPTNIDQDELNIAHHHFEKLIGQKWKVGKWFDNASEAGKWAIMEVNSTIHNIEWCLPRWNRFDHSYNCRDFINNTYSPHNQFEVLEGNKVTLDSYKCYQKTHPWGTVVLYYSQTGKPHYAAFEDKDEYVERENITGHKYVTGEAFIQLNWFPDTTEEYEKWLVHYGWDLNDVTECYYGLLVADIDKQDIYPRFGNDEKEVTKVYIEHDDVTKVGLADNNYKEVCSRDYSWYTWKDQYKTDKEFFK